MSSTRLLLIMVLSSAAASTQTTILPTARTTLSMAAYGALPGSFAKMHRRHLTPTVSTLVMGGISILLYAGMNYISGGNVIADAVTSCGVFIATYYGLTGFTCAWYYRKNLTSSARNLWMQGILPVLGGAILCSSAAGACTWTTTSPPYEASYTMFTIPGTDCPYRRRLHHRVRRLADRSAGFIYLRIKQPPSSRSRR